MILLIISAPSLLSQELQYTELKENWEYRWGDSPKNKAGKLIWLNPRQDRNGWNSITLPAWPKERNGRNYLWERTVLPRRSWRDPAVFLLHPFLYFEVYLDDSLIYKHDDLDKPAKLRVIGSAWKMIQLPADFAGKTLTFRIYSDYYLIGIPNTVLIGSEGALIERIIKMDTDRLIIGSLCFFMGLFSLFLFLRYTKLKEFLSFGSFALLIGIYIIRSTFLKQFLFDRPVFWTVIWVIVIAYMPAGIISFVGQIFGSGRKTVIKRIWQMHLLVATVLITILFSMPDRCSKFSLIAIRLLYIVYMVFILLFTARQAMKKNIDAGIFAAGFLLLIVFGLKDVLIGLGLIPWTRPVTHIGMFLFSLSMMAILTRRVILTFQNITLYSRKLKTMTAEKEKILEELHDGITGIMTNIVLLTDIIPAAKTQEEGETALKRISSLSREGLSEIRNFMNSLDENEMDWSAFASDLRLKSKQHFEAFGISCRVDTQISGSPPPPSSLMLLNLQRIFREAVTNIIKHAGATFVEIRLLIDEDIFELSVKDNGKGLKQRNRKGRGLKNMQYRIEELGGEMLITGNGGTMLQIRITSPKNTRKWR